MCKLNKIITGVIIVFISASTNLCAQWTTIFADSAYFMGDMYCINADTCWVAGSKGLFMKTTDGGINWNKIQMDTLKTFGGIYFLNDSIGYLSASPNEVLRTSDGGLTWSSNIPLTNCNALLGGQCYAINEDTAFFTGQCNNLNHSLNVTYDGGINVNEFSLPYACSLPQNYISKIYFQNDSIGYAVGFDEVLYKTTDRGISWNKIHEDCMNGSYINAYSMSCYNDTICWFGGSGINSTPYGLKYSSDGGINWLPYLNSQFGVVTDVAFFSDGNGYIIVDHDIWKTGDYGLSFNLQYSLFDPNPLPGPGLGHFVFLSSKVGYVLSQHTVIKTTNGGGPVSINELQSTSFVSITPNPSSGEFTISKFALVPGLWSLQIFDNFGKMVKQFFNINENEIHINLSDYPSGLYFVKSILGKKSASSKVLIIK